VPQVTGAVTTLLKHPALRFVQGVRSVPEAETETETGLSRQSRAVPGSPGKKDRELSQPHCYDSGAESFGPLASKGEAPVRFRALADRSNRPRGTAPCPTARRGSATRTRARAGEDA
jgi:hypothetical protein